jgi:hemerythrin-like domain-containing protein
MGKLFSKRYFIIKFIYNYANNYRKIYTYEEYIARSQISEQRMEYHKGKVYVMAVGIVKYTILCGNINRRLAERLADSDCMVYTSDM